MSWKVEVADDPALSAWSDVSAFVDRETLRCGGIANKTEVGTAGGFDRADDAGTASLPGRRPIRVIETATTPDTTLFYGRVSMKGVGRGTMPIGDAKQFDVSIDDYNQDLRGIIVDGWSRPAETDVARVTALWNAYLRGAASTSSRKRTSTNLTNTYIVATPTVSLPAERYDGTDPAGVLASICEATGKEAFVTVDGELFYAPGTSVAYASTYSITDSSPDLVNQLPPIWDGPAATEDPTELLSGALAKYGTATGQVSESRAGIEAAFDKWEVVVNLSATSEAKALLELDTLLDNQGIEEKSRRCTVVVPEDQVHRIKWGQTISYRAAASGDLSAVTLRISYLLWEPPMAEGGPYLAHLELSKPKKIGPRIKQRDPKPAPPLTPFVCDGPDYIVPWVPVAMAGACVIGGGAEICRTNDAGSAITLTGQTTYRMASTVFFAPDSDELTALLAGISIPGFPVQRFMGSKLDGTNITYAEDFFTVGGTAGDSYTFQAVLQHGGPVGTSGDACSISAAITYVSGPDSRFTGLLPCPPPLNGQPVNNESVAGAVAGTTFTANYPYLPGSLRILLPPGVIPTEIDPAAGTFSLPLDTTGEVVVFSYIAAGLAATGQNNPTSAAAVWPSIAGTIGDFVATRNGGGEIISTVAASGATETIDLDDGNVHDVTLTANCTLTFAAVASGRARSFTLLLRQDGTGSRLVTWPGSVVWPGGEAPTLSTTAAAVDVLTFFTLDGGTTWFGFEAGDHAHPASSLSSRWEPLTNGSDATPELIFALGDVVMVEVF